MKPSRFNYFIVAGFAGLAVWLLTSWVRGIPEAPLQYPASSTNVTVASGFAVLPLCASRPQQLNASLIGWWKLNDGNGVQPADSSGNNLNGQMVGPTHYPTWAIEGAAVALTFDGQQNEILVQNNAKLTPSQALTIAAWVRVGPHAGGTIVSKWDQGGAIVGSYTLSLVDGHPSVELSLQGQYRPLVSPQILPADGNWHHLVCTYDGLEVRLFLDGRRSAVTHTGGAIDVNNDPLIIGQVAGLIADVRIFSVALSDADVVMLYGGKPPLPVNGVLGAMNHSSHPRLPRRS